MNLIHIGTLNTGQLRDAQLTPVAEAPRLDKPVGSKVLWTSPTGSDYGWAHWSRDEHWYPSDKPLSFWHIEIPDTTRLYTIDALDDLVELCWRYPVDDTENSLAGFRLSTSINWPVLAEDFDGVYLTEHGQWATRMTEPSLYGWDCETVVLFRAASTARIIAQQRATLRYLLRHHRELAS